MDVATAKLQRRFCAAGLNPINASTFFGLVRMAGIEDHAVARLERPMQLQEDLFSLKAVNLSKEYAALFAKPGMDQFLVVGAAQPARVETPRKRHFHFVTRWIRNGVFRG